MPTIELYSCESTTDICLTLLTTKLQKEEGSFRLFRYFYCPETKVCIAYGSNKIAAQNCPGFESRTNSLHARRLVRFCNSRLSASRAVHIPILLVCTVPGTCPTLIDSNGVISSRAIVVAVYFLVVVQSQKRVVLATTTLKTAKNRFPRIGNQTR